MQVEPIKNHRAVNEFVCADAVGRSVHTLRKDRRTKRLIPFYRIGRSIRYNLDHVFDALKAYEVGGPASFSKKSRTARS